MKLKKNEEKKKKKKHNQNTKDKKVCKNNYAKESEKANALGLNSKNITK